jgi:hypothetical protein
MNTETPLDMSHANPPLFAALAKAQAELENASKTSRNEHFRSSYADLAEVLNRVRPVLSAHGIAVIQSPSFDGAQVHCETILAHCEGGWIAGRLSCVPAKVDGQGIGAASTYLRRYGLAAMAALAQQDDDGQAAAHDRRPAPASPPARKTAAKKVAPAISEERKGKLHDLRAAYLDAGVADGPAAEVMLRNAGLLPPEKHVTDLSDDELSAAWKLRFEVFQPTE